ncbi:hypothetical protein COCVIDRAFT_21291 [Bipolaris victoriae FI3]|uniref:Uncharacterized protein n=1 Tax=Bipolaris victoriae (strain FI3) TaxID=930091 RepID=W7E3S0_BIPV3|nr:hypothetical protein COCVIDRAFT_21291 [Bipolaris victoriae FI3]
MASLHKETSSLNHTAKVEDLFTFSSLLGDAEAFHLDEIRDAYDADLAGTGTIWAEEPPGVERCKSPLKTFRKRMLHNVIEEGNYAMAETLLRLSQDLRLDSSRDSIASGGLTYLQFTLCNGQGRILDAPLAAGLYIIAADERDMTPLHMTCMGSDRMMIKRLIDCKLVDANALDKKGSTTLYILLECGAGGISVDDDANVELCWLPLSRGASLDALDNDGNMTLHMACKSWDVRLINSLNEKVYHVDAMNGIGIIALHCLSMWVSVGSDQWLLSLVDVTHLEAIGSLSDRGTDKQTSRFESICVEYTPLVLAIASGERK